MLSDFCSVLTKKFQPWNLGYLIQIMGRLKSLLCDGAIIVEFNSWQMEAILIF